MSTGKKPSQFNHLPEEALLDDADIKAIQLEAKETVYKEEKKQARERALQRAIRAERSKVDPGEELIEFRIELAPYAPDIRLDNVIYTHNTVYKLTRHQVSAMREIIQQTWRNESQVVRPGTFRPVYGSQTGTVLSGSIY